MRRLGPQNTGQLARRGHPGETTGSGCFPFGIATSDDSDGLRLVHLGFDRVECVVDRPGTRDDGDKNECLVIGGRHADAIVEPAGLYRNPTGEPPMGSG